MPCNAHNHPPDCNCGWGGVFYPTAEGYTYGPGYWSREGSYSNPNAKCPVCVAAVFFYRSPDNGRVFFDHPGPPWPKHPCTHRESLKERTAFWSLGQQQNGWFPFPCKSIQAVRPNVAALVNTQDRVLYVPHDALALELESPVWVRRVDQSRKQYEMSLLVMTGGASKAIRLCAYVRLEALNQVMANGTSSSADPVQAPTDATMGTANAQSRSSENDTARHAKPMRGAPRPVLKLRKLPSEDAQQLTTPDASEATANMTVSKTQVTTAKPSRVRRNGTQSRAQPTLMELAFARLADADAAARQLLDALGKRP